MQDIGFVNKEDKKITFSESAKEILNEALKDQEEKGLGVRIMIGGGCCGPSYQMGLDKKQEKDKVLKAGGFEIFMDEGSYMSLSDMKVDYIKNSTQEGFKIENGHSEKEGGCGSGCSC